METAVIIGIVKSHFLLDRSTHGRDLKAGKFAAPIPMKTIICLVPFSFLIEDGGPDLYLREVVDPD